MLSTGVLLWRFQNAGAASCDPVLEDLMSDPKHPFGQFVHVSGVFPGLGARADMTPRRSECGIGALMPWAGKLWLITYVSHTASSGGGTGLYEVDENLQMQRHPESVVGTYANRMLHGPSDQLVIGPHLISAQGEVRTVRDLTEHRLTATMEHLQEPKNRVYFLTMEGLLFEVDVYTLRATQLANLVTELELPGNVKPHFKGGYTAQGVVVVANNSYDERDFAGTLAGGRLAEWDGTAWTVLERTGFNEVTGRGNWGQAVFATGWDRASALLKVRVDGGWTTYRLPKASHCYDHCWQTEWPRIREVESERYLMDCQGMFYELSPVLYGGRVWGVRPIATHLRIIPDFCSWRGMLVLAGNQVTPIGDANLLAGEPQAGLWFGKTDDLWRFGRPKGWGGVWWKNSLDAGSCSDPYLMTGFTGKVLHLSQQSGKTIRFGVEVDFLGDGTWYSYDEFEVPSSGYVHHEFPAGYSAHWVRLTAQDACTATAYFTYT